MRTLNIFVLARQSMLLSTVLRPNSVKARVLTTPGPSHLTNSLSYFFTREQGHMTTTCLAVRALLAAMPVLSDFQMRHTDSRIVVQGFLRFWIRKTFARKILIACARTITRGQLVLV